MLCKAQFIKQKGAIYQDNLIHILFNRIKWSCLRYLTHRPGRQVNRKWFLQVNGDYMINRTVTGLQKNCMHGDARFSVINPRPSQNNGSWALKKYVFIKYLEKYGTPLKCNEDVQWHRIKSTLVFVSQRTSSCCTRRERCPATWLPRTHGMQWHPGSRTSLNLPNFSLMATFDWSTCTQQRAWPIFFFFTSA